MSSEKHHTPSPGCDESLYNLLSALWVCQGSNWEAMTRQDAFATAMQPLKTEKTNLGIIIKVEIILSLLLIGASILIHWTSNSSASSAAFDAPTFPSAFEQRSR